MVIRRDISILLSRTTVILLSCCSFISTNLINLYIYNKGLGTINGLFYISSITQTFKVFIYILSMVILLLTSFYPRKYISLYVWKNEKDNLKILKEDIKEYSKIFKSKKDENIVKEKETNNFSFIFNKMAEQFRILEYSLIITLILTGTMFLLSTSDFVSLFLCIELQSYGLYLICTLYKNSELATSAGLTYFLLGGLASCFILLGIALFYSNSANMNLDGLHIISNLSDTNFNNINTISWYIPNYISYSLLVLVIGLLFKISAAPFHFWSPDVYDNIPTIVTTFVALIPKLSILIFMLELVHYTSNVLIDTDFNWTSSLLLSSLLSLIIGTVLGLTQSRIKRLFAYSTISHLGFILLALSVNSIESNQSFIFYLVQYTVSNLNAFIILLAMGYGLFFYISDNIEYNKLQDKNNSPIQLTNQIKGYHSLNPVLALSFGITLFSFVGIPPLIGFFAKQMVLSSALDKGYIFLVLIAILTSVIAAVYYLAIIRKMYFDKHEYIVIKWGKYNVNNIVLSNYLTVTISIITILMLLFIIIPQEFLNLSNILTLIVYTPY